MKKIPTLFQRGPDGRVIDQVTPGCEWVLAGEGVATWKWDGACCMVRDGKLFKRREAKAVELVARPIPHFEIVDVDPMTDKSYGWVPVGRGPEDRWFREGLEWHQRLIDGVAADGTYELVGPKINGNPERLPFHDLIPHGKTRDMDAPREFNDLRDYLYDLDIEGLVWWHTDGRKAKLKKKDFGLTRR